MMKPQKIQYYLELFWLVVSILTAGYAVYSLLIGREVRMMEYILPVVAFILFFSRRTVRRRLESSNEENS